MTDSDQDTQTASPVATQKPPVQRGAADKNPTQPDMDPLPGQLPRSIELVTGLNPIAALLCSAISALNLFSMAKTQAIALQATTEGLGWIKIALVAAWAGCAYLGFLANPAFRPSYVVLGLLNLAVAIFVFAREMWFDVPFGNSPLALGVALYLAACIAPLYSPKAVAVFDPVMTAGSGSPARTQRRFGDFLRDLFWR